MEHTALIYMMVMMSAADSDMTDNELAVIGDLIRTLPAFDDFNSEMLPELAANCAEILNQDDGLDTLLGLINDTLPERLHETAYLLTCDVAAADGEVQQEELRLLEMVRHRLDVDRLSAAAIERAARARFQTV
jgi:tellurite resistance protein